MLVEAISPELVLVLPEEERLAILASLPRRPADLVSMVGSSIEPLASRAPVEPPLVATPELSRRRFAAAVVAYLIWDIASAIPFLAGTFLAVSILTLVIASLA